VGPGVRAPLSALATAICVGRPYLGMHYPSDVLAGAFLGAVLGRLAPLPSADNSNQ
jgi:membrane-associated phospholipid phosphatase